MTNLELIREVRKPGKVCMPVLMAGDVVHIKVEKTDLIDYLEEFPPDGKAPWAFYGETRGGTRWLDTND